MKQVYLVMFLVLFGAGSLWAQTGKITGTIVDANNNPLFGVTVAIKGTTAGSITNADGVYSIEKVKDGEYTLIVSSVGYKSQEISTSVSGGSAITQDINMEEDFLNLDDVVVTGTFNPQSKLESSTSITTLDSKMIQMKAPRSTGDLIGNIPGFYVESGVGETGNNIYPRGIPVGTGGLRYTALREDGLNNFEISDKVFFNADGFTKNDLTIERVEGLRGGNAVVFSSNTPGGIINFVSKTGGPELKGDVRYTYGTQQLYRVDFNVGGALTEDKKWRFNIGGHYRYDKGLRDFTGPANLGGQFKVNITRLFDNDKGYIRFYGKVLEDQITFWSPIPYQGFSSPRAISDGLNLNTGTLIPSNLGDISIPDPLNPGEYRRVNMNNQTKFNYSNAGVEFQYDLGGGWKVKNQMRYMSGTAQSNLIQIVSNPIAGRALLANVGTLPGGTIPGNYITNVFYANPGISSGLNYSPGAVFGANIPITSLSNSTDPQAILSTGINNNGMLLPVGLFVVNSRNTNFINNLQFSKEIGTHSLTFGGYISAYNSDEYWSFNTMLTDVTSNPRLVDITFTSTAANGLVTPGTTYELTRGGTYQANFQFERSNTKNVTYAFFVGDEFKIGDRFTANAGFRYEINNVTGALQNTGRRDGRTAGVIRAGSPITVGLGGTGGLDSNPLTLFDSNADVPTGTYTAYETQYEVWGASIGANFKIDETLALFINASKGTRYATSQNFLANKDQGVVNGTKLAGQTNPADNGGYAAGTDISAISLRNPIEDVLQGEFGIRMSRRTFGFTATVFNTIVTNAPFTLQSSDAAGNIKLDVLLYDVQTIGGEFEAIYNPIKNLRFNTSISVQQPKYTKYPDVVVQEVNIADRSNPASATNTITLNGNNVERVPTFLVNFSADYTIGKFNIYGNVRYTGERWGNRRNTYKLPAFTELSAGVFYRPNNQFTVGIQGLNLLNSLGITEGNTRTQDNIGPNAAQNNDTVSTGVFILPRSANVTIQYSF